MEIAFFQNQETLAQRGSSLIIEQLKAQPQLKLCAATGNSPTGVYRELTRYAKTERELFTRIQIIKLDEWVGLDKDDQGSCEKYLQEHLIIPLAISEERFLSFIPNPINPAEECLRVQTEFNKISPIDICVLGLGKNGHIGFNEPGKFEPHCHIRQLEGESMTHSMIATSTFKPSRGMTLGMNDILSAKKIIMIVSGTGKEKATQGLLSGVVSTDCPASILWKHADVTCLIFQE